NPRDRGRWFVTGNRVTTYDGPWRARAGTATYVDVRDDPGCLYCLMPISDDRTVRAVRVDNPVGGRLAYVLIDWPIFAGYHHPVSTGSPELGTTPGDSSRLAYNPADHLPTTLSTSHQLKCAFTHTLSSKTYYEVRLSRLDFDVTTAVSDKTPGEYDTA